MITGSPHITNYKSRKYKSCELTHHIRNNGAFVRISYKYDKNSPSKVKRVCTPAPIVGNSVYDTYRKTANNWGWVEGNHDGGADVQVITQGEIIVPGANKTAGHAIYAIDLQRVNNVNYFAARKTPETNPGDFNNGADADLRYLLNNLGVVVENVGDDCKVIIWQGSEIPSIPSYNTGQSFRVYCKLSGDVNAGCPVLLFLDANGDLRGYNCPIPRMDTDSDGQLDTSGNASRYPEFGKWGVCETGGSNGDVVEIVIAGFVQVANPGAEGNKLYGDGTFDSYSTGDIHATDGWLKYFNATDSAAGSLEVQSGGAVSGDKRLDWTITNAGNSAGDVSLFNRFIPLSENVNYKFSMYAKAADAGAKITINLLDGKDSTETICSPTTITLTTDWVLYEHTFTLSDEGREYCDLYFQAGAGTDGNTASEQQTTIKIDNISLVEDGFTDKDAQVLAIGLTGFVHKDTAGNRDVLPGILGTLVNETGMICIDPGVPEGEIRDYTEQQIVKAKAWSTVTSSATDKKPVSLWRDSNGDLNCVTDFLINPTYENVTVVPEGKSGIQLEDSVGDKAYVDVLVRGKLEQDSAIFDLHTNVTSGLSPGEYIRNIDRTHGIGGSAPGDEFEMIFTENDRTLGSASNWVDFSPNSSITFSQDTGNNRIAITGSGTANNSSKKEGAHIPDAKILKRTNANWNLWSDLTGFTDNDSNWVWDSKTGSASVVPAGSDATHFSQTETSFADNETYRVSYTISNHKSGQIRVKLNSGVSGGTGYRHGLGATRTGNGDYTEIITINQDNGSSANTIFFQTYGSTSEDFTISNIKVEPLETGASVTNVGQTVALFKCTLWSASNTDPAIINCGRQDLSDGTASGEGYKYGLRFFDNGSNVLTTTEREAYAYVYFASGNASLDGFAIFQTNAVSTQWFFKNPSLTYLPLTCMTPHGIALSGDNKEYYLF